MLLPEQKRELSDELSRELDAAGVRPEIGSGKPRPKPAAPSAPKADAPKAEERKKSGTPRRDPREGGE